VPRRAKVEAERTRARILASALSLFAKKGFDRTTFTDIASRLKMTKGAVYWHFESKEALLVALVDEMLSKFARETESLMPKEELTFPAVAEMMVGNAERIIDDPKGKAFFMLMFTQVKWGEASMQKTREELLSRRHDSPYHTFMRAVENDMAAGRVVPGADAKSVAASCVAVWDGLVRARIDGMLECDLATTLRRAYAAVWASIKAE